MKKRQAGRPISPQKPTPKVETQVGDLWGERAATLIKTAMTDLNWGYRELAEGLEAGFGVEISAVALNRRINRGNFSAGFLLMCLEVLKVPLTGSQPTANAAPEKKTGMPLEEILGSWGGRKMSS